MEGSEQQAKEIVVVATSCPDCRQKVQKGEWPYVLPPYGLNMVEFLTKDGKFIDLCLEHSIERSQPRTILP